MSEKMKVETIEEFLARGGIIKRYPAVPLETDDVVRSTAKQDSQHLMDLDEGAHYFSEVKLKRARKKKDLLKEVDVANLPEHIRRMFNV